MESKPKRNPSFGSAGPSPFSPPGSLPKFSPNRKITVSDLTYETEEDLKSLVGFRSSSNSSKNNPDFHEFSHLIPEENIKNGHKKNEQEQFRGERLSTASTFLSDITSEEVPPPKILSPNSRPASRCSSRMSAPESLVEKDETIPAETKTLPDICTEQLNKENTSNPEIAADAITPTATISVNTNDAKAMSPNVSARKEAWEQRRKVAWEERKKEIGLTSEAENVSQVAGRLRKALSEGRATCALGFMDTSTLDTKELEAAVAEAQALQQQQAAAAAAENDGEKPTTPPSSWWLKYLLGAAQTVLNLRKLLVQFDFQGTAELLAGAVQQVIHPDAAEEVHEVAVFLESKRELYSIAEKLLDYALAGHSSGMSVWETEALTKRLPLSGDLYLPLTFQFAKRCAKQRRELKSGLAAAVQSADARLLRTVTTQAKIIRAEQAFLEEALMKLKEVQAMDQYLKSGTQLLSENDLRRCSDIGHKLGVEGIEKISAFRELKDSVLLKMKLRLALQRKEIHLAADILYDIKNLALSSPEVQETYALKNFPKLRESKYFSLRMMFEDESLKHGMLQFQSGPVMTSLTKLDPVLSMVAQRLFNYNVLGWGGQVTFTHPVVLVEELLRIGLEVPMLRDEIYIQILKQLTDCPEKETEHRLWQLLLFCLRTFSPNCPSLEIYIDVFLRKQHQISLLKHMYYLILKRKIELPGIENREVLLSRSEINMMLENPLISSCP